MDTSASKTMDTNASKEKEQYVSRQISKIENLEDRKAMFDLHKQLFSCFLRASTFFKPFRSGDLSSDKAKELDDSSRSEWFVSENKGFDRLSVSQIIQVLALDQGSTHMIYNTRKCDGSHFKIFCAGSFPEGGVNHAGFVNIEDKSLSGHFALIFFRGFTAVVNIDCNNLMISQGNLINPSRFSMVMFCDTDTKITMIGDDGTWKDIVSFDNNFPQRIVYHMGK
jgi:hypothetical protein